MYTRLTESQKRGQKLLKRVLGDSEFEADVAKLRETTNIYILVSGIANLASKYKLPNNTTLFLNHYMNTGEQDYTLITPPAYVMAPDGYHALAGGDIFRAAVLSQQDVDEYKASFVTLLISPHATLNEIKEALSLYNETLKAEQERIVGAKQKRVKERPHLERDRRIEKLHASGKSDQLIANLLNHDLTVDQTLNPSDVHKIILKMQRRKKTERSS